VIRSRAGRAAVILAAVVAVGLCPGRQTGHGSALRVTEALAQIAQGAAAPASHAEPTQASKVKGRILYYRNPMGLPDTSPVPKKDSMGMEYIPVYENEADGKTKARGSTSSPEPPSESTAGMGSPDAAAGTGPSSEPNLVPVTLTPQRMQSIGVKTGVVEFRPVRDEIRTVGNIEADETRLSDVQLRFAGWVQKVYADATYKQVRQGQPLLTIYSPELVTAEQDYLVARELLAKTTPEGSHGSQSLLDAVTERLKRWQVPDREIARLKTSGKIRHEIEIDSPASGFIIDRKAFSNMYVQPGMKLYSVADLSTVWVYAEIFQSDIGRVKVGDPASITVDSYPGQTFPARVSFIWPEVDQATRRARVRLEIPNPDVKLCSGCSSMSGSPCPLEISWRFQLPECFSPARVRSHSWTAAAGTLSPGISRSAPGPVTISSC
jgi:multidrug efflux pump subunit AcrA (membrane-fusion protein)